MNGELTHHFQKIETLLKHPSILEHFDAREEVKNALDRLKSIVEAADPKVAKDNPDASMILDSMADTFRQRNVVYGDNYKRVGAVMHAMFPSGVVLRTPEDFNRWHLFELQIVKLTRFANSGLTHQDSIHDEAVYAAMVESLITPTTTPIGGEK